MSARRERFSETHRKILGSRLQRIQKKLDEARELGLQSETLTTLYAEVEQLKGEVEAIVPPRPPHLLRTALVEALTLTYELRPRALGAYGSLPEESASYLEDWALRLGQLAGRLIDEVEGEERTDGGDG